MKDLIERMARELVDDSESVSVKEIASSSLTIYELTVAKEDMGLIIGKQGRNLEALRTIVAAVGSKHHRKALVVVLG
jgi:predicted RNA-binding protein YlqC (UPF0109 family)